MEMDFWFVNVVQKFLVAFSTCSKDEKRGELAGVAFWVKEEGLNTCHARELVKGGAL
jgi:hypothetical protein